jgi:hypothetical protein
LEVSDHGLIEILSRNLPVGNEEDRDESHSG